MEVNAEGSELLVQITDQSNQEIHSLETWVIHIYFGYF